MLEAIISRVEEISMMPTRGHPVHEYRKPDLREIHAANYRIIYQYTAESLTVVTVVHMRQRLP